MNAVCVLCHLGNECAIIIRCYVNCCALPLLHHRNTPSARVYWEFPIPVVSMLKLAWKLLKLVEVAY